MKKKLVILTLIIALLCLPLIACGGEQKAPTNKKVNLTEYAMPIDYSIGGEEVYPSSKLYTKANKLDGVYVTEKNSYGVALVRNADNKYGVYNLETGSYLLGGSAFSMAAFQNDFIGVAGTEQGQIALYTPFGEPVIAMSKISNLDINTESYYRAGKYETSEVYVVSYLPEGKTDEADTVNKYYVYEGETIKDAPSFKEVEFSSLRKNSNDNSVGATINALELRPVNSVGLGDTAGYVYGTQVNATYNGDTANAIVTFYKDGSETGSFSVKNGNMLGIVGKYAYYYEVESLPYDAKKGYNVYTQLSNDFTSAKKENVTYYRYDILKGKSSKYNPGYYIADDFSRAMFNYTTEQSDVTVVSAVNYVDGVASVTSTTPMRTYVVDQDLKVVADLTDKPYDFSYPAYKLKDNRVLIRGDYNSDTREATYYIVDDKLETVASFKAYQGCRIDKTGIITYVTSATNNYSTMGITFDGTVVFEPKYTVGLLNTFEGYAIASTENAGKLFSYNSANTSGTEITVGEHETINYNSSYGVAFKYNSDSRALTVYNAKGDVIATIANASSANISISKSGKAAYFNVTTTEGSATYILG